MTPQASHTPTGSSAESAAPWGLFTNATSAAKGRSTPVKLPEPPPWRRFDPGDDVASPYAPPALPTRQRQRGEVFRLPRDGGDTLTAEGEEVRLAVNAAIHLRRPLLITGTPGCGKTSLAFAIAHELGLGRVLCWPITPRSERQEGLYRYEALDRLRDSQPGSDVSTAEFITLGPLGTAFLPFEAPRVLLIDEIDKSDLQLPNELLHLFEEGGYEIPQLRREARQSNARPALVDTDDPGERALIRAGRVQCRAFPIVVMTSNKERDFPPAFHRRCIRVEMPTPTSRDTLLDVARHHFGAEGGGDLDEEAVLLRIDEFLGNKMGQVEVQLDRATDQLLNALHLLRGPEGKRPSQDQMEQLQKILFKRLGDGG